METIRRLLTDRNLDSDNVVIYPDEMVLYYRGKLETLIVVDKNDKEIERYYGFGLQKLIESAHRRKDNHYLLATRFFKPVKTQPKHLEMSRRDYDNHGPVCVCDICM